MSRYHRVVQLSLKITVMCLDLMGKHNIESRLPKECI